MRQFILLLLSALLFLTGCTDFKDTPGKSVWSEGLWLLPWVTGLGAAACAYKFGSAYKKYSDYKKAGNKARLGYGWAIFAGALVIATIVIIWKVITER